MPPTKKADYMKVRESFSGDLEGVPFVLNKDHVIPANDPAVRKYPQFFEPLTRPVVEQATAAPGERRGA